MTLGEKIKALRTEKGLTQADLADFVGVTKGAVSQYEKNLNKPSYEVLVSIAKLLGSSVDELLADVDVGIFQTGRVSTRGGVKASVNNSVTIEGQSMIDALERLAELRKQNLLTEEEFTLAKKRLLNI